MFDVGFSELFLLSLVGLLVLGPERLPGVARSIGGFVRKARRSWISLRRSIEAELNDADFTSPVRQAGQELKQIRSDLEEIPGFSPEKTNPPEPEADQGPGLDSATVEQPNPLQQDENAKQHDG